jgi:hypothetical protein
MQYREGISSYIAQHLSKPFVLHIDVFAYELDDNTVLFRYIITKRGKHKIMEYVFAGKLSEPDSNPRHVRAGSSALVDMALTDPFRFNAKRVFKGLTQWGYTYHHRWMRDLAWSIPMPKGFTRRSIKFHSFACPDHDPTQGFKNWYAAKPRRARRPHGWRDMVKDPVTGEYRAAQ